MKKNLLLTFLFSFLLGGYSYGQLADGTSAPDWTATDLNGNVHDMSDILASGKHVVLEFSATWCGPCWSYHNTGYLETLYDTYGPDGTDQIRVFYIESSASTNEACLYGPTGCVGGTQGNWVAGHDFPFIHIEAGNAPNMGNDYQVPYFPTLYGVSANTSGVYLVGQANVAEWESWLFESFEMQASAAVVDAPCPGEGSITVNTTGGYNNINYQWSNGAGNTSVVTGLSAGTYTVTITDSNGYFVEETYTVDGPASGPLSAQLLASSDVNCAGTATGALNINAAGGNGGYSYNWNNGFTGPFVDNLTAGSYTVTITDVAGCTTEETYSITEPPVLTLSALTSNADCGASNGSVTGIGVGGVTPYTFNYGNGPNFTGQFNNVAPGNYMLSVTDANGCEETYAFEITSTDGPDASAAAAAEIDCGNTTTTVTGAGSASGSDISYQWTTTDGNIVEGADDLEAIVDAAGTYTLIVTDNTTGCSSEASTAVVSNVDLPDVNIATPAGIDCNVSAVTIDASGSASGANFTYNWSTTDGNIVGGTDGNTVEVDDAGTYFLVVTNTDNGCTTEESISVSADLSEPDISATGAELNCSANEVEICADVAQGVEVTWMIEGNEVSGTCVMVAAAGSFTATATAPNGCTNTAEASVTLSTDLPQVEVDEPSAITCTVTTTTLNGTLDGDISEHSISWSTSDGTIDEGENTLTPTVSAAGTYMLSVINNSSGCETVLSVSVDEIIVDPVSGFSFEVVDGVITFTSNSQGDPNSYEWSFGDTNANSTTTFDENGTYEICLTVVNDCGTDTYCEDVAYAVALTYEAESSSVICFGEADGYIDVTPSGGQEPYTAAWEGPNGFTSSDLSIADLMPGSYTLSLSDDFGYNKTETFEIAESVEMTEGSVAIQDEVDSEANGSISLEVNGEGDLTYLWSNGATGSTIDGLPAGDYTVEVTDENGCSREFGPYQVSNSVNVIDLDFVESVSLYPNPATNWITVEANLTEKSNVRVRVIDLNGKVFSVNNFNVKDINTTINVSEIPAGVYFLEFGNNTGRRLEKFVVIK